MDKYNYNLGKIGETIAMRYLQKKNFEIIESNFFTKWGEIDVVAKKDNKFHFIEVKTRTNLDHGRPEAAITRRKIQKTRRAVLIYLRQKKLENLLYQIDALAILYNNQTNQASVRYFPNIFL